MSLEGRCPFRMETSPRRDADTQIDCPIAHIHPSVACVLSQKGGHLDGDKAHTDPTDI
jgi:hypothetical protein